MRQSRSNIDLTPSDRKQMTPCGISEIAKVVIIDNDYHLISNT